MDNVEEKTHLEPEEGHLEHGKALFEWDVPEHAKYERSKLWYLAAVVIAAFLLFFAFRSGNFLFAVIIVMFAIVIFLNTLRAPAELRFALTERGMVWGAHYYPYIEIGSFWIVYQPPKVKNIYIEFKSILRPRLIIPMLDHDPVAIREFLKKVAREDTSRQDEPLSDFLGRILKI